MLSISTTVRKLYTKPSLLGIRSSPLRVRGLSYNAKAFVPNENGPNIHIIRWLSKEMETEGLPDVENGAYKARAFQRACKAIDALPEAITSGNEALNVVGIGEGIARRIDEYLNQNSEGTSSKLHASSQKSQEEIERERALSEFKRVPGIGPVKALRLYEAGCRSLGDLRKPEHMKSLSSPVRVALEYVDHLGERVTRAEVQAVTQTIQPLLSSETRMHVVGSYRRGLATCGDIDIILLHPSCVYVPRPGEKASGDLSSSTPVTTRRGRPSKHITPSRARQDTLLRQFVLSPLERSGVLAATLSEGSRKWQGIVRIPRGNRNSEIESRIRGASCIYRRMDLSLYPSLSEGAALLATTGDADFNSHVRRSASRMGLLLNEFGLWRFCRRSPATLSTYENGGSYTDDDGHWELVASTTEREILDELGVEYVEPERRNFSFVVSRSKQGSMLKSQSSVSKLRRGKGK